MSLPLVVDSPVYVLLTFYDVRQDLYFQTSDYNFVKQINGITTGKPLQVGDELKVGDRLVTVKEINVHFGDYVHDYSRGIVHSHHGKEIPYVLQVEVWTEDQ